MQSLRILPDLRSSVVEEKHPGQVLLFTSERDDSDASLTGDSMVRPFSWRTFVDALRDPDLELLEVAEPLWLGEWRKALRYVAVAKVVRPRITVATYAIENFDARERLATRAGRTAMGVSMLGLDAVAFGTTGAYENHRRAFGWALRRTRHAVLPPRLDACTVCGPSTAAPREPVVLFLGAPSERKGFPVLLEAWRRTAPEGWRLVVADPSGDETPELPPGAEVRRQPAREAVHELLRTSAVVVMPSVRRPGWREQIGLPLVEGLAHGCRVVTTTETGLADDLRAHPDVHLTTPGDPDDLARGLREAMDRGRADRPERRGFSKREVTDWWLAATKTRRRAATTSPR
ncbi:glycosyltransferase family 4 protein [Actinomycetospora atypica]|uniref:Glycosyltransferase family 4 protein n=1 Tax=Actinomycetospora atypica TaxID=1290095 RepID=A0ABV9YST7_9PSEU